MTEQDALTLNELPPVLLAQTLEFADLRTLLALECACTSLQQLIRDFRTCLVATTNRKRSQTNVCHLVCES